MIVSFGNRATEDLFNGISSSRARKLPNQIREAALYKLDVLNAVQSLEELKSPPGNRLEALRGDLAGQHS
ncbi:MAG: plasmid maintenance system killer protein, partial [Arenicellales bacterium]|nr:plasmid maintenance system killer protein [Arenicellales bacterium]